MQTFLPYANFAHTAKILDRQRLGKQRVEVLQILLTLKNNKGWIHHPAVKMWKGYEYSLAKYGIQICKEWISRGYQDTCYDKIVITASHFKYSNKLPWWLGNRKFHTSHKSNLLRKNFEYYSQFGWKCPSDLPYMWPTK